MSQNHSRHELGGGLPPRRELIAPITDTVREQQPLETDLVGTVLAGVARQVDQLSTPDVLALRAQLTVDIDETAPVVTRVGAIVDAILAEVEHWKRGAVA